MTMVETRVGNQRPRLSLIPPDADDTAAGDEVIEFSRRFGLVLDDWQQWVVRHMCSERVDGSWSSSQSVLLVPRQCGKSAILEAIEMTAMFLWDEQHVIYSAHLGKTATDHMRRIRRHIDTVPDFRRTCRVMTGVGTERVEMHDGRILEFITRGKKTARGGSPNRVIFDEAMFLTDDQIQAMLPALSAQSMNEDGEAQMIYASSAPIAESQVLHRLRTRAISDAPPSRMFFAEWSAHEDCDPADRDNWYQANPGLGVRISEDWVADNEYATMSPEGFGTERLGIPVDHQTGAGPISTERWGQLADAESMATDDTLSLGLSAPLDRSTACFSVYGRRADGAPHAAIRYWVKPEDIGQVVEVAKQLAEGHGVQINVPPNDPAAAWLDDLESAGVAVNQPRAADLVKAEQAIEQEVADGTLRHRGQIDMATAVGGLAARTSGDSSPWSRRSSTSNIAPLMALAAARAGGPGEKPAEFFAY